MGELVFGYFGTKLHTQPPTAEIDEALVRDMLQLAQDTDGIDGMPELLDSYAKDTTMIDIQFIASNIDYMDRFRDRLGEIEVFITTSMRFIKSSSLIELEKRPMRFMAMDDLGRQALKTSKWYWAKRPAYFVALTLEFHERMERIRLIS